MIYWILISSWMVFFALHSVLASEKTKLLFKRNFPTLHPYYRIFYNIVATFSLFFVLIYHFSIHPMVLLIFPYWVKLVAYFLILSGIIISILAFKNYDLKEFLGLSHLNNFKESTPKLCITGLNAYVRHPLYFGILVALIGYVLNSFTDINLCLSFVTVCYLIVGTYLEEQKLLNTYGKSYQQYRRKVKMLIPFLY